MRDLVYTDNIDAVGNVLGGPGGGQDGNTSGFNLRGLGSSSTLTMFDGRRVVNNEEVGSIVPDIALSRMEIVLDGGSALYGSDAVAGVVNLIPIKEYDGIRARSTYGRDQEGTMEEYSLGLLFGREINDFNIVAALQYKKETPMMRYERPWWTLLAALSATTRMTKASLTVSPAVSAWPTASAVRFSSASGSSTTAPTNSTPAMST